MSDLILGQVVPLSLQLSGAETNKYPRVRIYNSAGSEVAESPIDLTHVANGLYKNATYNMPASAFVIAQYTVYSDAGHTTVDTTYSTRVTETYDLFDSNVLLNTITPIGAVVSASELLTGEVTTGDLFAEVEDC